MVIGGSRAGAFSGAVEIIDLETTMSNCLLFTPLPTLMYSGMGYFGHNNTAIVCGGLSTTNTVDNRCYILSNSKWLPTFPMIQVRSDAAMSKSPFSDQPQSLFVTGKIILNETP